MGTNNPQRKLGKKLSNTLVELLPATLPVVILYSDSRTNLIEYNLASKPETCPLRRFLNVGGGTKKIAVPTIFDDFEHVLLDIDPRGNPDIVCDARNLHALPAGQFDAIYCSHNLEHYFRHDVPKVLAGFLNVLKEGGFAFILVPDILELMRLTLNRGLDIDDVLYVSNAGPIMVVDVLYGFSKQIEQSGQDFYAHKTGFSIKSLNNALLSAGFSITYSQSEQMEIRVAAFKGKPNPELQALLKLDTANT